MGSILQFFLLLSKTADTVVHPLLVHIFVTKHQHHHITRIVRISRDQKKSINPTWENSRPSFTKSTSLPTTTVKKERKKMNGVIYYLLTSFTAKKKTRPSPPNKRCQG